MTMPEPVELEPQAEQVIVDQTPVVPSEADVTGGRGMSLRSLMTLGLSVCALAFLGWAIITHPGHQSLFGPAPTAQAIAASQPAPPHPVGG